MEVLKLSEHEAQHVSTEEANSLIYSNILMVINSL